VQLLTEDNFDRADNADLGTNWDLVNSLTTWKILSNHAEPSNPVATDNIEVINTPKIPIDQFASANLTVVSTDTAGAGVGLVLRGITSATTLYRCVISHGATTNTRISRYNAGAGTVLVTTNIASWTDGDRFLFTIQTTGANARLALYRNGVEVASVIDTSPLLTGAPGLVLSTNVTSAQADNFQAGSMESSAYITTRFPGNRAVLRRA